MDKTNEPVNKPKELKWTTYRGKLEPIIEQHLCKIILHKNHVEVLSSYDYTSTDYNDEFEIETTMEVIKFHAVLPRKELALIRTITTHDLDEDKEPINIIQLCHANFEHWIWTGSMKDTNRIFKELRKWMLGG